MKLHNGIDGNMWVAAGGALVFELRALELGTGFLRRDVVRLLAHGIRPLFQDDERGGTVTVARYYENTDLTGDVVATVEVGALGPAELLALRRPLMTAVREAYARGLEEGEERGREAVFEMVAVHGRGHPDLARL